MAVDLSPIDKDLLENIAGLHGMPNGAFNVRKNGKLVERNNSANVTIETNDQGGLEVKVKDNAKRETIFVPVILTKVGMVDTVYNNFHIGRGANVEIIAGCGIHNDEHKTTQHDGIHSFYCGEGSYTKYIEKHYGNGAADGTRILNPQTKVVLEKNAICEMEMSQIGGVTSTIRESNITIGQGAKLIITEKLMTEGNQTATSNMKIELVGNGSSVQVISRSVAKDHSQQVFNPLVTGNAKCSGHVQCDSIIMGKAKVKSIPAIEAAHEDAQLVHEAAIGKIAGDQLVKLMTLGLSEEEAEAQILDDFLS
ncbi:MAG: SufD family Fe-S cluster assembly protein [Coriobacteriia bacterium]|nr:SufD family Fe-S cluster assembly protein [Coriobacteriia bacterium]